MPGLGDRVVEAIRTGDDATLRLLLHPYLHWTDERGVTTRGRTMVLAMLARSGEPALPRAVELRDGQVYRWDAGP